MNLSKEQIAELKEFICKTYILDGQDVEKDLTEKFGAKEEFRGKKVLGIYYKELTAEEREKNQCFTGLILELEDGILLQGNTTDVVIPFSEWKGSKQTEQRG